MSTHDHRTKPKSMWTYYVIDHLPTLANIHRFDTPEEAIACYRSLDPSLRSAIGSSLDGVHEMDHIHRCSNDTPVLVTASDHIRNPLWRNSTEIQNAVDQMITALDVQNQRSSDLFAQGLPSVIVPLDRYTAHKLDSYFSHSILLPDQPQQYSSSITEAFVMGHGWLSRDAFLRLLNGSRSGRDGIPTDVFLERLNVRYMDTRTGYIGEADISPLQFSLLKQRTEHLLSPAALHTEINTLLSTYSDRDYDKGKLLPEDIKPGELHRLLKDLLLDPTLSADMRDSADELYRRVLALLPQDIREESLAIRINEASGSPLHEKQKQAARVSCDISR